MTRSGWRRGQARWFGVGGAVLVVALSRAERACAQAAVPLSEGPSQSAAEESPLVEVIAVGNRGALQRAKRLLPEGALGRFRIDWQSATRFNPERFLDESETNAVARCFIDFSNLPEVRLYFADRRAQRFLLRNTTLSQAPSEIDREVLSQIVELSLQAVLQPDAPGLTREQTRSILAQPTVAPPPPEEPPVPEAAVAPRRLWNLRAAAFYSIAAHSDKVALVNGPGIALALVRATSDLALALELRGKYQLSKQFRGPQVGLEFSEISLELAAEVLWLFVPGNPNSFSVGPKLGAGLDFSYLSPLPGSDNSQVSPTASRVSRTAIMSVGLIARLPLFAHLGLWAEFAATVDPARVEYDLILPTGTEPILERSRIRPGGIVGIQSSW